MGLINIIMFFTVHCINIVVPTQQHHNFFSKKLWSYYLNRGSWVWKHFCKPLRYATLPPHKDFLLSCWSQPQPATFLLLWNCGVTNEWSHHLSIRIQSIWVPCQCQNLCFWTWSIPGKKGAKCYVTTNIEWSSLMQPKLFFMPKAFKGEMKLCVLQNCNYWPPQICCS